MNCLFGSRSRARNQLLRSNLSTRINLGSIRPKVLVPLAPLALAPYVGVPCISQAEDSCREIEIKYIFGFTEGSGIGFVGEKEFSPDTIANSGKREGRYTAGETELKFQYTPNQFVRFEFGPIAIYHNIQNVTGLDNPNAGTFGGFFGEFSYLLLDRSQSSPPALTLSIEPEWHNSDETTGQGVVNYGVETSLNGDLELFNNLAYAGFNLLYESERTLTQEASPKMRQRSVYPAPSPTEFSRTSRSAPRPGICGITRRSDVAHSSDMRFTSGRTSMLRLPPTRLRRSPGTTKPPATRLVQRGISISPTFQKSLQGSKHRSSSR